jgi:predicted nucleotidyltransferase
LNKRLSYAVDFTSFLLERIDERNIERIILFGSASRGEADKESDIDIFIETINKVDIKKRIEKIKDDFTNSVKFQKYWDLKGINNEIKIIAGRLDDWRDLRNSVIANGIVLYGKYESTPANATHKTVYSWGKIKPDSKRVLLFKRLFGYKAEKKGYEGMVDKYGGEKLGTGSIIIPTKHALVFMQLFKKMKITVKIRKMAEYS